MKALRIGNAVHNQVLRRHIKKATELLERTLQQMTPCSRSIRLQLDEEVVGHPAP